MKTTKQIAGMIASIKTSSGKLADSIQNACEDVAVHTLCHGDISLAVSLLDAVGSGSNKESLAKWLADFSFLRCKEENYFASKDGIKKAKEGFSTQEEYAAAYAEYLKTCRKWNDDKEQNKRVAKVFDSFHEAELLVARLLAKGDQQLAAKMKAVLVEYKASVTL